MACRMWLRQISCKGRSIFSSHWSHFPLLAIFSFPWTWHLEQKCFRQELHWNKKKIGYKKKYKLFLLAKENNSSQPLLSPKNIIATYNCSVSLFECSLINVTLYFVGFFTRRWILYRLLDSYKNVNITQILSKIIIRGRIKAEKSMDQKIVKLLMKLIRRVLTKHSFQRNQNLEI